MTKQKRYIVTADFYIEARNDNEAKVKVAQWAEEFRQELNNQAAILELHEAPFGSLTTKLIHKGNLTLFENKIIEKHN